MWESDWGFYEDSTDESRAFVALDLAASAHAPLESHPLRLQIRFAMQNPREDGLRSSEEADAIFALEDRIVEAMVKAAQVIHVGRIVAQGYTELVLYLPAAMKEAADNPPAAVGEVAPYQLEWFIEDDPEWDKYQELYPNRYAMQSISNRRLVRQMVELGDRLEVAREIDHVAMFPDEDKARGAAAELAKKGFRVDELEGSEVQFHREDSCEGGRPDEFVFEILDVIEPFEGEYDGWGSMLVKD